MQLRPDQLAQLVDTAVNPFLLIDRDGTVLWAGGSIHELLGFRADELVGRSALDLISPTSRDAAIEALANAASEAARPDQQPTQSWEGVGPMLEAIRADGSVTTCALAVASSTRTGLPGILLQLRRANSTQALEAVLVAMGTGQAVSEVLAHVGEVLAGELPDADVTILHRASDAERLRPAADPTGLFDDDSLPVGLSAQWAAATAEPGSVVERSIDQLPPPLRDLAATRGYCWVALLAVEPFPGQAEAPAAITIWSRSTQRLHFLSHQRVQRAARLATVALRWEWGRRALEWSATHDGLTGLHNRTAFMAELRHPGGRRASDRSAVLYLDLDDFKPVNDGHGHAIGDRVLTEVAARLRAAVRPQDMVARLGGDEFAVLCPGLTELGDATRLAERLVEQMRVPVAIDDLEVRVGLSIGIALIDDPEAAERVLSQADDALRQAKADGKSRWRIVS